MIGIDEGQFFPDIVEFSETMANLGKVVIISALDGTFQRKKFNQILELVPLAECVMKLNAVCMMCAGEAAFTKRIKTNDNRLEVIGGTEMYMAACRECFNKTGNFYKNENDSFLAVGIFFRLWCFPTEHGFLHPTAKKKLNTHDQFFFYFLPDVR